MNLAVSPGSLAISGYTNLFNNAILSLWSGTIPATPETTATGTQLFTFTFAATPFSTLTIVPPFDTLSATFTGPGTFLNAGTAGYGRAVMAAPAARVNTTAYTRGNLVTASSNLYVCIAPGTTSGTSTLTTATYGIVDGTAAFDYVGVAAVSSVLADFTVGTSGTDIVLGTTTITSGVTVTITSFKIQVSTV